MKDILALLRGKIFSLHCRWFRKNIVIGRNLRMYGRLDIIAKGRLVMGDNCQIRGISGFPHKFVCLAVSSPKSEIIIGDNAILCAARITAKFGIYIGDNVIIEDASIMDTDFHTIERSRVEPEYETEDKCRVHIGNRVGIGAQSFVMKGVDIGDDVLIAPSSVVTKGVKAGHFVFGNPARAIPREQIVS